MRNRKHGQAHPEPDANGALHISDRVRLQIERDAILDVAAAGVDVRTGIGHQNGEPAWRQRTDLLAVFGRGAADGRSGKSGMTEKDHFGFARRRIGYDDLFGRRFTGQCWNGQCQRCQHNCTNSQFQHISPKKNHGLWPQPRHSEAIPGCKSKNDRCRSDIICPELVGQNAMAQQNFAAFFALTGARAERVSGKTLCRSRAKMTCPTKDRQVIHPIRRRPSRVRARGPS